MHWEIYRGFLFLSTPFIVIWEHCFVVHTFRFLYQKLFQHLHNIFIQCKCLYIRKVCVQQCVMYDSVSISIEIVRMSNAASSRMTQFRANFISGQNALLSLMSFIFHFITYVSACSISNGIKIRIPWNWAWFDWV